MTTTFWKRYWRDPFVAIATIFLFLLIGAAIFAPTVAPFPPDKQDILNTFLMPNTDHWLGTDDFGRDTFSRIIYGARLMIQSIAIAMGLALTIGIPLGLLSGYLGGIFDRIIMWFVDVLFSLPGVMVAFAIVAILGPGLVNAMIAVGIAFSTRFVRLTRGVVLAEREELYVDSAKVGGLPTARILFSHLLPNILPSLIVQTVLLSGAVLLVEAGLSYLGLGVNVGEPSWGRMLLDMQQSIRIYSFGVLPSGLAIVLTVLALNLVGDGIRDALGRDVHNHQLTAAKRRTSAIADDVSHAEDAVLSVRGLSVHFPSPQGSLQILNDISFELKPGETLGLVGESGSGKSMTALSTLGLVPSPGQVTGGSVQYNGRELTTLSENELNKIRGKEISIIFQEPWAALNPTLKVGDQLTEKLQWHLGLNNSEAHTRALELFTLVHIPEPERRLNEYPHQFSGGMAQRVGIAMALACDPCLLVADEPTTALDVTVQGQVLDLLKNLQQELGLAIIFITHDLGVVAEVADRVAVMYAGEVVESGSAREVFETPGHPYTKALLDTLPHHGRMGDSAKGKLPVIDGLVPPPSDWPTGCRFHTRCQFATAVCSVEGELPMVAIEGKEHFSRCLRIGDL